MSTINLLMLTSLPYLSRANKIPTYISLSFKKTTPKELFKAFRQKFLSFLGKMKQLHQNRVISELIWFFKLIGGVCWCTLQIPIMSHKNWFWVRCCLVCRIQDHVIFVCYLPLPCHSVMHLTHLCVTLCSMTPCTL